MAANPIFIETIFIETIEIETIERRGYRWLGPVLTQTLQPVVSVVDSRPEPNRFSSRV